MARKINAHAVIVPFQQYPAVRQKFRDEHPKIRIIEEIKTLNMIGIEVPDTQIIGKTKIEQTIGIAWAIIWEEEIKEKRILLPE